MGIISEQQKQDFDAAMREAVAELDVVRWQKQQAIDDDLRQTLADALGISVPMLKRVTFVTQEAVAAPDLEIGVGEFHEPWTAAGEREAYSRNRPVNATETSPLSRAIDATRTQFEAPSIRMVNADPWTPKQS
jgi:hypothetical protein